jgi:hypothetical protein
MGLSYRAILSEIGRSFMFLSVSVGRRGIGMMEGQRNSENWKRIRGECGRKTGEQNPLSAFERISWTHNSTHHHTSLCLMILIFLVNLWMKYLHFFHHMFLLVFFLSPILSLLCTVSLRYRHGNLYNTFNS